MKGRLASLLLLGLLLLSHQASAYISGIDYYGAGELSPKYVELDSGNQNSGFYKVVYHAKTVTLEWTIISTLPSVGAVELFGPANCGGNSQASAACISNTGPKVFSLAKGVVLKPGQDAGGYQYFSGSVKLSNVEEAMLFDNELYIIVNTVVEIDGKDQQKPILRGRISLFPTKSTLIGLLDFEKNSGEYPGAKSKSKSKGVGVISHDPANNNIQITVFTSIENPGQYALRCGGRTKVLDNGSKSFSKTVTFEAEETPLLLDMFANGDCYVFVSSAAFVDGDLYSRIQPTSAFNIHGNGKALEVNSAYFLYSDVDFDYGNKQLRVVSKSNITDVTDVSIVNKEGIKLCTLGATLPKTSSCQINETDVSELQNGQLAVRISTTAFPSGELQGPIKFNGKATSLNGASLNGGLALALGLGIGLGVVVLVLVGALVFFVVKKGGPGGGKI